jgi:hypothetical protein
LVQVLHFEQAAGLPGGVERRLKAPAVARKLWPARKAEINLEIRAHPYRPWLNDSPYLALAVFHAVAQFWIVRLQFSS